MQSVKCSVGGKRQIAIKFSADGRNEFGGLGGAFDRIVGIRIEWFRIEPAESGWTR